jgi:TatA/E family protein of Tat protein translocase
MDALLQPAHLVMIIVIVLILFGPGKLTDLGKGLGRGISDFRRGPPFMAKGVDPAIGHDVRERFEDESYISTRTLYLCIFSFLIGNVIYFILSPVLPPAARMDAGSSPGLPVLVDIWICSMVFGFINLMRFVREQTRPR